MRQLYDRAFEILNKELQACAKNDLAGEYGLKIVLKRLEKKRSKSGTPLTLDELWDLINDQFPKFDQAVLKKAASSNRPPGLFSKILLGMGILGGAAGFVAIANLPYPMIRWSVAKTAPFLLMPSYISMDYNYRQAISLVEQADQLVNQATAIADINLGTEKVQKAQKHLDQLPVWFLGYYPQTYCSFMACRWRFTFDEFETARKNVGRMEAKVFQEQNAYREFTALETTIKETQEKFPQIPPGGEQQQTIAAWQKAIDQLEQIPPQTLAGKLAEKQLASAQRDFKDKVGFVAGTLQGNTLIEAAMQFAIQAAKAAKNPPHSPQEWERVVKLWQEAINRLEKVSIDNPSYLDAQTKLAEYQVNLGIAQMRLETEKEARESVKQAKKMIADWQKNARSNNPDLEVLTSELNDIINTLQQVEAGTTVTSEAQDLLRSAEHTLNKLYLN